MLLTLFWQRTHGAASEFTVDLRNEEGTPMYTWDVGFSPSELTDWQPGERRRGQFAAHTRSNGQRPLSSLFCRAGLAPGCAATECATTNLYASGCGNGRFPLHPNNSQRPTHHPRRLHIVCKPVNPLHHPRLASKCRIPRQLQRLRPFSGCRRPTADTIRWATSQLDTPTTGWAAGEYIIDTHQLTLPDTLPANLSLHIGLYDPDTNLRLQAG
ncbi:MAG: hypothetical protein R3E31_11595 [Chloroflexota bacterium]